MPRPLSSGDQKRYHDLFLSASLLRKYFGDDSSVAFSSQSLQVLVQMLERRA